MADNSSTPTSGLAIASDDIGSVQFQRIKLIHGADGVNAGDVATTNPLPVATYNNATVSTANSSTANLAGAALFTGTSEDVYDYAQIVVNVYSSHASATDGLSLQQSSDGTNWDLLDVYTIPAATGKTFSIGVQARYFRLVYTNGATLTSSLRIQTIFSKGYKKGSSIRPQDARPNENDFEEVMAYLGGFNGATWDRLRASVKGTQGAVALQTHDMKDTGRTHVRYYAVAAAAGATTVETAITLTKSSGTSATSTGASQTPASGKTFRITSITFATRSHATATIQSTTFNLRVNTAGAVTTSTTPILLSARCANAATASAWDRFTIPFPEGMEIAGNGTLQFGVTANATYTTNAPTWDVVIDGYEY